MKSIVIKTKNASEFKFLNDFLRKNKITSALISDEELEDLALSKLMKNSDKKKRVSEETILKKLKG